MENRLGHHCQREKSCQCVNGPRGDWSKTNLWAENHFTFVTSSYTHTHSAAFTIEHTSNEFNRFKCCAWKCGSCFGKSFPIHVSICLSHHAFHINRRLIIIISFRHSVLPEWGSRQQNKSIHIHMTRKFVHHMPTEYYLMRHLHAIMALHQRFVWKDKDTRAFHVCCLCSELKHQRIKCTYRHMI